MRSSPSVRLSARGKPGMSATGAKYSRPFLLEQIVRHPGGHGFVAERRGRREALLREGR